MAAHCWHEFPGFTLGNGARRYRCCSCGYEADGSAVMENHQPEGHGPYAPVERVRVLRRPQIISECPTPIHPGKQ
jgi:hypothetical protein